MIYGEPIAFLRSGVAVDRSWAHLIKARDDGEKIRNRPDGECRIENCSKPLLSGGFCDAHYARLCRLRRSGIKNPTLEQVATRRQGGRQPLNKKCSYPGGGCGRKSYGWGLCRLHYNRLRRSMGLSSKS